MARIKSSPVTDGTASPGRLVVMVLLISAATGSLISYAPDLIISAYCALALAVFAYLKPKAYIALSALCFLFVRTLAFRFDSGIIGYLDEVLVGIAVVVIPLSRIASRQSLRTMPGAMPFTIFLALGVVSAFINNVPINVLISGLLLAGKGIAFGLAVAQIDWRSEDLPRIAKFGCWVMSFVLGCAAINVVLPSFWLNTVLKAPSFGPRFGLQPILGPFVHPGYFGTCLALFALSLLAYRLHVRSSLGNTVLLAGSLFFAILTFRRKVLAALAVGAGYLVARSWGVLGLIAVVALAPILVFVSWGYLSAVASMTYSEYVVDYDEVARVRLYIDGMQLASQHFPFGLGFGRFGTGAARADYSPVYLDLGYQYVWGLGPGASNGKFLTDTFWPGVVGETGLLGGCAYAAALISIFRASRRYSRKLGTDKLARWIAVVVSAWTLELTIESVAGAVYTAAPTYGLFFGAVGIFAAVIANDTNGRVLPASEASKTRSPSQTVP